MTVSLRRSVLYIPGSNARAIAKAPSLDVDAVILDLEDAVAPDAKAAARAQVMAAVRGGGFGHRAVVIRVNHASTAWGLEDLRAAAAAGPDAILLPKVGTPEDILRAGAELARCGAPERTRLWIMIETPAAVVDLADLGRAAHNPATRLAALVLGTNDLAAELRVRHAPGRLPLLGWLANVVAVARCHGLHAIDGVHNRLDDPDGFRAECEQGRAFGFDGKTLIHPDQIATCNQVFSPSAEDLAWAEAVTRAFADPSNAGKGVLKVEGRMVERLDADMAARLRAVARTIATRNQAAPPHGALTSRGISR